MPKESQTRKYCANVKGGFSAKTFGNYKLPASIVLAVVDASNSALARNTWSSYRTAESHIKKCEEDTGIKIRFPMTTQMTIAYVGWLITVRKVKSTTISQYLAGLRMAHLKHGVLPSNLRPDIVNLILNGQKNLDSKKEKAPRMAMTIPIMKLLKLLLTKSKWSQEKKRLVWAVACLAFHGSFRIHELLSRSSTEFDPSSTLLGSDIKEISLDVDEKNENILMVHLKSPKEDKLKAGVTVELFGNDTFSCPIKAFKKWRQASKMNLTGSMPAFRLPCGKCYTGSQFNQDIKSMLGKYINYDEKRYLAHSFRAGLASMMAAAGYADTEIMRQGRWNSRETDNIKMVPGHCTTCCQDLAD